MIWFSKQKHLEDRVKELEEANRKTHVAENCKNGIHDWLLGFRIKDHWWNMDATKPFIRCKHCFTEYKNPAPGPKK